MGQLPGPIRTHSGKDFHQAFHDVLKRVHVVVEHHHLEVGDRAVAAAPPRGLAGYGSGSLSHLLLLLLDG